MFGLNKKDNIVPKMSSLNRKDKLRFNNNEKHFL